MWIIIERVESDKTCAWLFEKEGTSKRKIMVIHNGNMSEFEFDKNAIWLLQSLLKGKE